MATLTKGLAAQYSFNTQPTAFERPVFIDRLSRVLGAAWREAAMLAEKRAQCQLICSNQRQ